MEQFQDLVKQMDDHKSALAVKVQDRTGELESTEKEIESLTTKIENLKQKIGAQELTIEDVRKMHNEKARLKEMLERTQAMKAHNKEVEWKALSDLIENLENLESTIDKYNTNISNLSLLKEESLRDETLKMTLDKKMALEGDQCELLGVDLHGKVQPLLIQLKSASAETLMTTRRDLQNDLDKLETSEERLTEAIDKLKVSSIVYVVSSHCQSN